MKSFMSITDIQRLLNPLCEKFFGEGHTISLEKIYREIFQQIEAQAKSLFEQAEKEDKQFLQTFTFICTLCFDIYTKKQLLEHLIDRQFQPESQEKPKKK
mgnify:CR=1 FL=1